MWLWCDRKTSMTHIDSRGVWKLQYIILWLAAIICVGLGLFAIPFLGVDSSTWAVIGAVTAALTTVYQSTRTENQQA